MVMNTSERNVTARPVLTPGLVDLIPLDSFRVSSSLSLDKKSPQSEKMSQKCKLYDKKSPHSEKKTQNCKFR